MQYLKQQKTSAFAPIILKRWIASVFSRCDNKHSRLRRFHLCYIRFFLITIHLLFLRILKWKRRKCPTNVCAAQQILSSLIWNFMCKRSKTSLAAVSFAFIGKMIKDIEFCVQDSLHKHFSICKPPFLSQNSPIGRLVRSSSAK